MLGTRADLASAEEGSCGEAGGGQHTSDGQNPVPELTIKMRLEPHRKAEPITESYLSSESRAVLAASLSGLK